MTFGVVEDVTLWLVKGRDRGGRTIFVENAVHNLATVPDEPFSEGLAPSEDYRRWCCSTQIGRG